MDYIYSQLDPSVFDLSKCLIYHNFKDLPDPQEDLYKRVAFVTQSDDFDLLNDSMYICLLVEGRYTWINAFTTGVDDKVIESLREMIATKASIAEVVESFQEVMGIINQMNQVIETKADEEIVDQNIQTILAKLDDKADKVMVEPLIINVKHTNEGLELDQKWQDIWDAYQEGKSVLCKYWPEWRTGATYYPPRTLYPMVGIGMVDPEKYVCYTGDGTFKTEYPEGYPIIELGSEGDGELVPVQITCTREDRILSVDEALTLAAFADFGGDYIIEWECTPITGELSDFHYFREGNELTVTPKASVLKLDYEPQIKIVAKIHGVPSICTPVLIKAVPMVV